MHLVFLKVFCECIVRWDRNYCLAIPWKYLFLHNIHFLYLKNEELGSEIEELNASLAKAREATHKAHVQKFKVRTSNLL